jgi:UDP-glucose 4-epimerase
VDLPVLSIVLRRSLSDLLAKVDFDAVIHFAALKAVGESVERPLSYYHNNITGTVHLLEAMQEHGVRRLIFSSSATVYGDPARVPVTEDMPLGATNPYGKTKHAIEEMCRDVAASDPSDPWWIALFRYFNPVGAHATGRIGEVPRGIPNNLMPFVLQVAVGIRDKVSVFGDDYPTDDGTPVRDYIHVVDLARGHTAALDRLDDLQGCHAINLGTGRGYSVLEVLRAVSEAVGREIPYEITGRRRGDVAVLYADPTRAGEVLGWKAELGLERVCADAWRWQSDNPKGYAGENGAS